jgi:hypothetical protein
MKKQLIILIVLFFQNYSFSQKIERQKKLKPYEDTINKVFKSVLKTDQYYTTKWLIPDDVRNTMYNSNLSIIKHYIDRGLLQKDSCDVYSRKAYSSIRQATHITFLHILKYSPQLMLNKKFIDYIGNNFDNDLFHKKIIIESLEFYYSIIKWESYHDGEIPVFIQKFNHDHKYDDLFYEALKRWGIDESTLRHDRIIIIGH